ncbi:MAG: LLM class flavin-dependent oxidoreductase [Chloroflexota bacterium]
MEIGIDSFAGNPSTNGQDSASSRMQAMAELLERMALAEQVGLDVFGIGQHFRKDFLDSAQTVILAAAAARTSQIKLTSAVTVLSVTDPVVTFQNFATLDIISQGRAEIVAGRGSFTDGFPLFGYELADYDEIFAEKLDLLLQLRANEVLTWSGRFRPPLNNQPIYPRPVQDPLPVWLGVGGTPGSFVRAGKLGLRLMAAVIGGETRRFRSRIDMYRQAYAQSGHPPEEMTVGLHSLGYVAETTQQAHDEYFPGYAELFNSVSEERGWRPVTREGFDAQVGPTGALLVGSPEEVAEKVVRHSEALGGISRLTFNMDNPLMSHEKMMRSIELIGTRVMPMVKERISKMTYPVAEIDTKENNR